MFGCGQLTRTLRLLVHDKLGLCYHAVSLGTLGIDGWRIGGCGQR